MHLFDFRSKGRDLFIVDNGSPFLKQLIEFRFIFKDIIKKNMKSVCIREIRVNPIGNIPGPSPLPRSSIIASEFLIFPPSMD